MLRRRSFRARLASHASVSFVLSLFLGATSCGSDDDDDDDEEGLENGDDTTPADGESRAEECYGCGAEACPDEAAACDDSPVCTTLRDCTLACAATDAACQNDCTTEASSDSNAIVLGATFVACATANCPDECVGSPESEPGDAFSRRRGFVRRPQRLGCWVRHRRE
jgi:hypothetical protein